MIKNTDMKKYIIFILLLCCSVINAQVEIDVKQLVGTKWRVYSPNMPKDYYRVMEFKEKCLVQYHHYSFDEDTLKSQFQYYLSNEIPVSFTEENNRRGKYLVGRSVLYENPLYNGMWYYTITKFSESEMLLFRKAEGLKEGHVAMGGLPKDYTLTLKRIYE